MVISLSGCEAPHLQVGLLITFLAGVHPAHRGSEKCETLPSGFSRTLGQKLWREEEGKEDKRKGTADHRGLLCSLVMLLGS